MRWPQKEQAARGRRLGRRRPTPRATPRPDPAEQGEPRARCSDWRAVSVLADSNARLAAAPSADDRRARRDTRRSGRGSPAVSEAMGRPGSVVEISRTIEDCVAMPSCSPRPACLYEISSKAAICPIRRRTGLVAVCRAVDVSLEELSRATSGWWSPSSSTPAIQARGVRAPGPRMPPARTWWCSPVAASTRTAASGTRVGRATTSTSSWT